MSAVLEKLNDLPEGWESVPLKDAVQVILGQSPKSSTYNQEGEGLPFFQGKTEFGEIYPTVRKWCTEPKKIAEAEDVLVSVRAPVGPTNLAPYECAIGRGLAALRPLGGSDPKYFLYLIRRYQDSLAALGTGTTFEAISGDTLKNFVVPLAPPEQQKRIVAKIEELFSHIDAGIEALKKAKQLLKQYRQSVLKSAVTGELMGNVFQEGMFKSIEHGLESLGQGWSPKCEKEPSPSEDIWGVIKTTAVQAQKYLQEENKKLPEKLEPRPHLEVNVGDILVTRAGPRVRVGVCCLVKETRKKLMICDKVYRLRPNTEAILPEYLETVLNAPQVHQEIENLKTGISDSGVNLTQKRFVELKIPYPSIEKQRMIVGLVYEKTEAIARLENEIDVQTIKAEKNKQSILASAFKGGLHERDI